MRSKATQRGVAYLQRFEIKAVAHFQGEKPIFGEMNSNSRIYTQNVEAIKSLIAVWTIPLLDDLRTRRFTSRPLEKPKRQTHHSLKLLFSICIKNKSWYFCFRMQCQTQNFEGNLIYMKTLFFRGRSEDVSYQ